RELAEAYLRFLFEPEAQELAARHHYRPHDEAVLARHDLPAVRLFRIEDVFGDWDAIHTAHFAEGALFDRVSARGGAR
ncbi:MAG TPA: sulfate ABC transporter substrate-binding protein, partial [Sandaracinaceae bacterium]